MANNGSFDTKMTNVELAASKVKSQRELDRDLIQSDVDKFLARGGEVIQVPVTVGTVSKAAAQSGGHLPGEKKTVD